MVEITEPFDATQVPEDERSFEPIPAGTYKMQVIESKIEDTKSGSGQMLVLTLEVVDGQFQNRRIWDRLNVRNQNPDAQRIAQRALADLCLSVGVEKLKDTEELHFKPFTARVRIEQDRTGQYGPQNRVRYVNPKQGSAPAGKAPANAPAGKAGGKPAAASTSKPWNQPKAQAAAAAAPLDDEIPF